MEFTKEVITLGDLLEVLMTSSPDELRKPIQVNSFYQPSIDASFMIDKDEPVFVFTEEYSADDVTRFIIAVSADFDYYVENGYAFLDKNFQDRFFFYNWAYSNGIKFANSVVRALELDPEIFNGSHDKDNLVYTVTDYCEEYVYDALFSEVFKKVGQ